jgi:hypothetical protein
MIVIWRPRLADALPWSIRDSHSTPAPNVPLVKAPNVVARLFLLLEARIVGGDAFCEHVVPISWLEQIQCLFLS